MPAPQRLVILGGGFGGAYTYLNLHRVLHRRRGALTLTVVDRENYFLFTPMLHEVATGGLNRSNLVQPLRYIFRCCHPAILTATVEGIDCAAATVRTSRGVIPYDLLVIALGATTNYFGVPGAAEHTHGLKSLADAARLRNQLLEMLEAATNTSDEAARHRYLCWVVVGGGPTGVELAAELVDFARAYGAVVSDCPTHLLEVRLLQDGETILPEFSSGFRARSQTLLERKGVRITCNARVSEVRATGVTSTAGEIETATVIWAAGVRPAALNITPARLVNSNGRLPVTPELSVPEYPNVFVVGDIAELPGVPQTAQAAVAAARTAGNNIVATLTGQPRRPFVFRKRGDLVSIGQWQAVGRIGPVFIQGRFAWWLWRTVYLSNLIGWTNRIRVAVDWTLNLVSPRDISRLD